MIAMKQKAFCTNGKYKGESVRVNAVILGYNPELYDCTVIKNGKEVVLYESEIETVFEHDMRMLEDYKKIVNK